MRPTLPTDKIHSDAHQTMANFHKDVVKEVENAVSSHEWVMVGMSQNPVVKSARQFLDSHSVDYKYIQYGSYVSKWKERLAIKLWSGWPTFPQIFHNGVLVGGFKDLKIYLQKNPLGKK